MKSQRALPMGQNKQKQPEDIKLSNRLVRVFYQTVHHFFPDFLSWLKAVVDPRQKNSCTYQIQTLLWVGILLFMLKRGARRQIDADFVAEQFINHLAYLCKQQLDKMLHNTTLDYLLQMLDATTLAQMRYLMIKKLLRNKCLAKSRLFGHYLITIDGTGYTVFERRHCAHCLTKKVRTKHGKKKRIYYHPVVEAKLVTANGFALSIETEFIENLEPGVKRQDCELNAAYRLLKRLAKHFPQLRICLLLDSLYVSEGILNLCADHNWRHLIVLKEKKAPELYREYEVLKKRCPENFWAYEWAQRDEKQNYHWVTNLDYKFEGRHFVNILACLVEKKKVRRGERKHSRWLWLTNFYIDAKRCVRLANEGGRLRWKTENEGFNMQKNGGYNMEHTYSYDFNAAKCYYLLMQIAHIINQLLEKGSLLTADFRKQLGSIRKIAERLLEELRTSFLAPGEIDELLATRIQIRFDTS